MADYVISTKYTIDTRSALSSLNVLKQKLVDLSRVTNSVKLNIDVRSGLSAIGSLEKSLDRIKEKSSGIKIVSPMKGGGSGSGVGAGMPVAAAGGMSGGIFSSFAHGISGATLSVVAFAAALGYGTKKLFSYIDEYRQESADLQTRIRMSMPKELAAGKVTYRDIENSVDFLNEQMTKIANSMGADVADVSHSFRLFSSVLKENAGYSLNKSMNFTEKFERAKPVLAAVTPSPETIVREMTMFIASGTLDASTPLYTDVIGLMGSDPRMRGGVAGIRKLPVEERAQFVEDLLDKISSVVNKPLETVSKQFTILSNNLRMLAIGNLTGAFNMLVSAMKSLNDVVTSLSMSRLFHSLSSFFDALGSMASIVFDTIGAFTGFATKGTELNGLLDIMTAAFRVLASAMYAFEGVMSLVARDMIGIVGKIVSALSGYFTSLKPMQETLNFAWQSANQNVIDIEKKINATWSDPKNSKKDTIIDGILNAPGHKRATSNVTQNNNIVVNLQNDLPPDLIADTFLDALKRSAMQPTSSARIPSEFGAAR